MNLIDAKVHFIGVGGIGMSGIAEVLINMGCSVSGSDKSENPQVLRLKGLGARISLGHDARHIPNDCHVIVYSSAVTPDNPEILEGIKRKTPIIQRAEMLAELMRLKRAIAIGGSHGKTTTTSIVATMMLEAKMDPTIVIGGRLDLIKSNAALGKGQWFVAEADESDGSFLRFNPELAVITNIDNDHLDHFKNMDNLKQAFAQFASRIPFYGCAIYCHDDIIANDVMKNFNKRSMSYGMTEGSQLRASNLTVANRRPKFSVSLRGKPLTDLHLSVPGDHNVLNALAAFAVGLELKLPVDVLTKGIEAYKGVDRRLQVKGEYQGAIVIDDYGHHPTEVKATLQAVKQAYPDKKIHVVFQPHRYTRTKICWDEFLKCFDLADHLYLLDIYAASENPIENINSERLARELKMAGRSVQYVGGIDSAVLAIKKDIKPGIALLTLGAGDVSKLGPVLVDG